MRTRATGTVHAGVRPSIPGRRCGTREQVPPILLSGNHAKVDQWRRKQSILRTRRRRPDLYERLDLSSKADQKILKELRAEEPELFPED